MNYSETIEKYNSPAIKVLSMHTARVLCLSPGLSVETDEEENQLP